ncbi:hypothetical protein BKI52_17255 [marine bacterium AO1-C]|nr:hypothetical protein BKI52_17255 [marine bacterium AO1-C]
MRINILFILVVNIFCISGYSQKNTIQITFEIDGKKQDMLNQFELFFISKTDTFKSVTKRNTLKNLPFKGTRLIDAALFKYKKHVIVFDSLAINLNSANTFDKATKWVFGVHNRGKQASRYVTIEWEKSPWKKIAKLFYWKIYRADEEGVGRFEYEEIK